MLEDIMNIVVVGHVDHGKSTVIGHLLADTDSLPKGKLDAIREDLPLLLRVSGIKLLVMPAIWGAMAVAAGLSSEQVVTLTIVGSMPAAVNVYIITDKLGGDGKTACGAVVVTHLLSLFTMTGVVFILRSAGLI